MLSDGLVNGLAVYQMFRQPGMFEYRCQTHAVVQILHGARLASRASRHAYVHFVPRFPNNAIGNWCWGVNSSTGADAVVSGGADVGTGAVVGGAGEERRRAE